MLSWLWSRSDLFKLMSAQGWPMGRTRLFGRPYGVPAGLEPRGAR